MSFGFLNVAMLLGLLAVALPVLAHLISRRRFDVVQWGAMQFLQLGQKTRRRIRLEELLLMLLRMGVLGLIAFGMARPWGTGGLLSSLTGRVSRDVVLVIDGSMSMGWKGPVNTPHAQAVQWAHQCLDTLRPGDTVSVLDVRDQIRPVIDTPTGDFDLARTVIDELPMPSGSSDLASGLRHALQILGRTSNVSREVIVLTDRQKLPWRLDDVYQWTRVDDTIKQMSVPPRVWVVNVVDEVQDRVNVAVGQAELSRELTVPEFPIRVRAAISQSNSASKRVTAQLEIDGIKQPEKSQSIELPPNGSTTIEFEHRFANTGSHQIGIVVEADALAGDDRSDAIVEVADGIPVLVVDGDPQSDPILSESFFVSSAFSATKETAWVRAEIVPPQDFHAHSFQGKAIVWLLNVPVLTVPQAEGMVKFVESGGSVVFAAGSKNVAGWYPLLPAPLAVKLAPVKLVEIQSDTELKLGAMRLDPDSLKAPWLERFQPEQGVDFTSVRFAKWWKMEPVTSQASPSEPAKPTDLTTSTSGEIDAEATAQNRDEGSVVLAQLVNTQPWLVSRRLGKGYILQLATPLDSDWSTLPSKNDFVPFLHEIVFQYSTQRASRNVASGAPLVVIDPPLGELNVKGPTDKTIPLHSQFEGDQRVARFTQTTLSGLYEIRSAAIAEKPERFVVNFDRRESELTTLTPAEEQGLFAKGLVLAVDAQAVAHHANDQSARSEFWWWLMLIVLGLLVFEVVMTRRLVQGGHILVEPEHG